MGLVRGNYFLFMALHFCKFVREWAFLEHEGIGYHEWDEHGWS